MQPVCTTPSRRTPNTVSLIVREGEDDILTATQRGFGKRTELAEYPRKGRLVRKGVNPAGAWPSRSA